MSESTDPAADPAAEFGRELNDKVTSSALADSILVGLVAMKTNSWTGMLEPDYPTRFKYAALACQYKIGKPLERKELDANQAGRSLEDMKALARKSPSFRANLIRMLQEVIDDTTEG